MFAEIIVFREIKNQNHLDLFLLPQNNHLQMKKYGKQQYIGEHWGLTVNLKLSFANVHFSVGLTENNPAVAFGYAPSATAYIFINRKLYVSLWLDRYWA